MAESVYLTARRYANAGLSVIPIKTDGSKAPAVGWDIYKTQIADDRTLRGWFSLGSYGIAIIGGAVSGNLERIDFDLPGSCKAWADLAKECGYGELIESLPLVRTPRSKQCYHLYYRCESTVQGNQPLARYLDPDSKVKVAIETRGEGGYTIAPGSPAEVHETGNPYVLIRGDLCNIPVISADDREALLEIARSFNEYNKAVPSRPEPERGGAPGDDYNARGDWREVLQGQGWSHVWGKGEVEYWRRPGKSKGISATWNCKGSEVLYVFSTNALPFEAERSYTPFGVYTTILHNGNYSAAAKALSDEGYGTPATTATVTHTPRKDEKQVDDKGLAFFAQTDLGNAERFLARHGNDLLYCPAFGKWFVWDNTRWAEDETGKVVQRAALTVRKMLDEAQTLVDEAAQRRLIKYARASESNSKIYAMLSLARAWLGIGSDELDSDPWLLNCKNGILDLRNCELLPHRQDNYITKLAPWDYDPAAECPTWLKFLDSIFQGNQHIIGYIQRAVGYALTGVIREQCLFFLHGVGSNGKSTFLNVIQDVLGDYAKDTPTESLMIKQNDGISNDIARLRGARFVTAVEAEADKRMAESLVKRLTGGDTITARFMRQEFFQFRGTFKIFLAANHKPGVRGTDDGIWRRIKMIPFLVRIPDDQQDATLPDRLRDEAEGILAWAVRGCQIWQKQGLGEPEEVRAATAEYRDEMDFLGPFITDRCVLQATQSIKASDLYKEYLDYCDVNKDKPLSSTKFGRMMMDRPGIRKQRHSSGNGIEYWGIGLSKYGACLNLEEQTEYDEI
ncbi:MAG: phage/plasmid primase, P4 family [Armatimonadota bacterium]|nr:phage/plasmid primase, P4 family [bacterium]